MNLDGEGKGGREGRDFSQDLVVVVIDLVKYKL